MALFLFQGKGWKNIQHSKICPKTKLLTRIQLRNWKVPGTRFISVTRNPFSRTKLPKIDARWRLIVNRSSAIWCRSENFFSLLWKTITLGFDFLMDTLWFIWLIRLFAFRLNDWYKRKQWSYLSGSLKFQTFYCTFLKIGQPRSLFLLYLSFLITSVASRIRTLIVRVV